MGTDNNAPGIPQSQIQKIKETKMTTGLRLKRRPSRMGVTKLASKVCSSSYQAAGRTACHNVSNIRKPTVASRRMPALGPK